MRKPSKVCAYPGCVNKAHAKGLCNKHYKRMKKFPANMKPKEYEEIKELWFEHKNKKYQNLINGWYNCVSGGQ